MSTAVFSLPDLTEIVRVEGNAVGFLGEYLYYVVFGSLHQVYLASGEETVVASGFGSLLFDGEQQRVLVPSVDEAGPYFALELPVSWQGE